MGILGAIVGPIFKEISGVVSEVIVDKDKRFELQSELARLEIELTDKAEQRVHDEMLAQIEVNKIEAASPRLFVSGWRPFIGWTGGFGVAYMFIIEPIGAFIARLSGYAGTFPELPSESLLFLVSGLLGFGGLRTWEKIKGVAAEPGNASQILSKPVNLLPDSFKKK